jgi:hypothetical protein
MKQTSLNDRLQLTCSDVGLYQRLTMYSWRRTAILETRRAEGIEAARDLAGHRSGSNSIYAYDNIGLSDKDINAARLGEEQVSRSDLRKMFDQALRALPAAPAAPAEPATDEISLQEEMDLWVKSQCAVDADCIAVENEYRIL